MEIVIKSYLNKSVGDVKAVLMILLVFLIVIYLYFPYIQNYSTTPKWVLLLVVSLIFFILKFRKEVSVSMGLLLWSLFIFQYFIQCAGSYNFWDSVLHGIPLILAPFTVVTMSKYISKTDEFYRQLALVLSVLTLPLLVYIVFLIGSALANDTYSHGLTYNFRFTMGHRNQLSQFLTLLIPLIVAGSITEKTTKKSRLLFYTVILLICIVVSFLQCRSALMVLFLIYPGTFLLHYVSKKSRKVKLVFTVGLIVLATTFGLVLRSGLGKSIPVFQQFTEVGFGSGNERVRIWENSLDLWCESPLTGIGSGNWKIEILRTPLRFTQAENSIVFYQRAHNDFIQTGTENGWIGFCLLVIFFIIVCINLFRADISSKFRFTMLSGIFGFILIANFSFPLEKIELLILLFLFALPGFTKKISGRWGYILNAGLVTIGTLSFIASTKWLSEERNYFKYKQGQDINLLLGSNPTFYTIDPISAPLYWHIGNHYYDQAKFKAAVKNYQKALKYNPHHVHVLNNLGSTYLAMGMNDSAKENYDKALKINPLFTETLMNYAAFHFNTGYVDGALGYILQVRVDQEPHNYKAFIELIGKAKVELLIEKHSDPALKSFFNQCYSDSDLLYKISVNCRNTGASYEDELLKYYNG